MDKKQIEDALDVFVTACQEAGYPFTSFCLKETYPGDISTPYTLKIKAPWIDEVGYFTSMVELSQILRKQIPREVRLHIFNIDVYKSGDTFPCYSEDIKKYQESVKA